MAVVDYDAEELIQEKWPQTLYVIWPVTFAAYVGKADFYGAQKTLLV